MTEKLSKEIYIDPHVSLKDRDVKGNLRYLDGYPMFGLVEFNIWGACNRRCSFCPVSDPEVYTNKVEGIELEDYLIVLNDLKSYASLSMGIISEKIRNADLITINTTFFNSTFAKALSKQCRFFLGISKPVVTTRK